MGIDLVLRIGPGSHDPQPPSVLPTADALSEPDFVRKHPRLRLFNVKYSPNLGDGLLSECLEQALADLGAHPDTRSIDLAARSGFGTASRSRSTQMRLLDALPAKARKLAVRVPLAVEARRRWRPHYRASLVETDAMVIGGGNLLADIDLNFPTKIAIAIKEAAQRQIPAYIYGCGVSPHWTRRGRDLLRSALDLGMVKRVFVRDEFSRSAWDDMFGTGSGLPAEIVRDPGLLAMERYRIACRPAADRQSMIGLNVTSQLALRYHGADVLSDDQMDAWYLQLAGQILAAGFGLTVFTNGSPEDRASLARLRPRLEGLALGARIEFPEANTPEQLAWLIAGLSGIAAFRMHAIIAAYSCGVPFLALAWDPKLDGFVQSVNCSQWLCRPGGTSPQEAADQLFAAISTGVALDERNEVVAQARQGVAALYGEIVRHLA